MSALPDDVRALLEAPNYAHLATLMPDGAPHSVPIFIGLEDGQIAFLTGPTSLKARNLARDPRVAISVTAHDQPYSMATVRGRVVRRLEGEAGWAAVDRIAHKYFGGPYPREAGERVVFLVEPDRAWARVFG